MPGRGVPRAAGSRGRRDQPQSMTSLSTHDTKRGEDVRARLAVLAELPDRWAAFAEQFLCRHRRTERAVRLLPGPDAGRGRPGRARTGCTRTRRRPCGRPARSTTWTAPVEALRGGRARRGRPRVRRPRASGRRGTSSMTLITEPGWSNALGQKLVQLTMPGSPRRLPGHRAVGGLAGRPGQPAAGRLRRTRRGVAGPGRPAQARRWTMRRAPPSSWSPGTRCSARRDHPELFTGYAAARGRRAGGRPPGRLRPGRRGHPGHPAAPRPAAAAGGWGSTTIRLPDAATDVARRTPYSGEVALPTCSATCRSPCCSRD